MRFTTVTLAYTFCMSSLLVGVQAGYPSEKFDELNNKDRSLKGGKGNGEKKDGGGKIERKKGVDDSVKGGKAAKPGDGRGDGGGVEKGAKSAKGAFAGEGEVTLLVKISSEKGEEAAAAATNVQGSGMVMKLDKVHIVAINVPEGSAKKYIEQLKKESGVESVEMETEVYALPYFPHSNENNDNNDNNEGLRGGGSRQRQLAEDLPYGITMVQSEQLIQRAAAMGKTPVPRKICVIDTGYGLGHPDLPNTTSQGHDVAGFSPYPGESWDFDGHGHGSHCAGTIGAIKGNNEGVIGVNPDPTKFSFHIGKGLTDSGSGTSTGVIAAVNDCMDQEANVISMSLGGGGYSSTSAATYAEAYAKGVLVIAAAGNDGDETLGYPASYPHVMSVAAVDSSRNHASFSQYNSQVEIAAPGVGIKSTITTSGGGDFGYASWSGTSMATPHVAGVAALVWSYFPDCTNHQIRMVLLRTADDAGAPLCDIEYGHGIVNADAAFQLLEEDGCAAGDDGSGISSPGGCAQWPENIAPTPAPTSFDCAADKTFKLDLTTDNYGSETSWTIKNSEGTNQKTGSGYGSNKDYTENWCKGITGCATFTIADAYGDGLCCSYGSGSYTLTYGGVEVPNTGGAFGSSASTDFGCNSTPTPPPTPSPTPSPTPPPMTSPTPPPGCDGESLTVSLLTDNYGSETTWKVENPTQVIGSGGPYAANTQYTHVQCIPSGCATFTIADTYGDGICCGYGGGSYEVKLNGNMVAEGGEFTNSEATTFGCPTTTPPVSAPSPPPTPSPTPQPTPSPTPFPTPSPTSSPTPAGCHAFCESDPEPWVAAPNDSTKCQNPNCMNCAQCTVLTCVQGCYNLDISTSNKCDWMDCAGCTDCVDLV